MASLTIDTVLGPSPAVMIRSYRGDETSQILAGYASDVASLAEEGWQVASTCWFEEPRGFWYWGLRALNRRSSFLVVTYERQ